IKGIAFEHMNRGKHIITTKVEHPSVFEACRSLESFGFDITYLPVNQDGIVSVEDVAEAIREDTILISIMHVNNEMGAIQPIESIGEIAKQHPKLFFHVDDVQGVGKVPLHLSNSGIDLCTMSGHKINGLKGTGVLYVKKGTALFPLFHGGNQEQGIRPGTENLAGAVAMAKALRLIKAREANDLPSLQDKQKRLIKGLDKIPNVCVNTPARSAPHIVNFSVPGFKPEVLIHMLGEKDIFVSTKSACSSKETDASRILLACGHHKERASSALRISLSYDTTDEDIAIFLKQVEQPIQQLKQVMEKMDMEFDHILIRYGETALNGKNRKILIEGIRQNVQHKLKEFSDVQVKRTQGRIFVLLNGHDPQPIIDKCRTVCGIHSMSLASKVDNDVEQIKHAALRALQNRTDVHTFKVVVKRVDKSFPVRSQDMNQVLGAHLLKNTEGFRVDVHNPDLFVHVEIRKEATYVTSDVIAGLKGLPVGTSGKTLLMLSGGIDSPVAGY